MKNLRIFQTMAVFLTCTLNSCASTAYLETPLVQKQIRFSEQDLYWNTCKKEKSIWGKITSKENCAEYLEEKFTKDDFKKLKEANFRCISIDTYHD